MSQHRAGQILDAIIDLLAASPDLAVPSIFRDRNLSMQEQMGEIPCVTVNEASDEPLDETGFNNTQFIDSLLEVEITGYTVGATEFDVMEDLRRQRACVHAAMLSHIGGGTDPLGLPWVITVNYGGKQSHDIAHAEKMAGSMLTTWFIHYRMSVADPRD